MVWYTPRLLLLLLLLLLLFLVLIPALPSPHPERADYHLVLERANAVADLGALAVTTE